MFKTRFAWLIELGTSEACAPRYLAQNGNGPVFWTSDHFIAKRFASQEEAASFAGSRVGGDVRVCGARLGLVTKFFLVSGLILLWFAIASFPSAVWAFILWLILQ